MICAERICQCFTNDDDDDELLSLVKGKIRTGEVLQESDAHHDDWNALCVGPGHGRWRSFPHPELHASLLDPADVSTVGLELVRNLHVGRLQGQASSEQTALERSVVKRGQSKRSVHPRFANNCHWEPFERYLFYLPPPPC